jgi:hypothetical protein
MKRAGRRSALLVLEGLIAFKRLEVAVGFVAPILSVLKGYLKKVNEING